MATVLLIWKRAALKLFFCERNLPRKRSDHIESGNYRVINSHVFHPHVSLDTAADSVKVTTLVSNVVLAYPVSYTHLDVYKRQG